MYLAREEEKKSTSDSQEEDSEFQKGDTEDFSDSDEEDLTIRFSK